MAATLSSVQVARLPGGYVMASGLATLSNNYQANGETLNLSSYLLGTGSPIVILSGDDGYEAQHSRGTSTAGLILAYEAGEDAAALDEVASNTDTSAVICTFHAIGQQA